MKITLGHIIVFLFITLGYYTSINWFIIPFIEDNIEDNNGKQAFGGFISVIMLIYSIAFIGVNLQKNWNKGFNINLNFKKQNKE